MATAQDTRHNRDIRLGALYERLDGLDMAPYWKVNRDVDNDEEQQLLRGRKAVPHIWRFADIEPCLVEAAELVTMDDSERRSLILVNPGLAPTRATVSTMYSAYRLNDPREVMPPHRHSPNAVRIGLTGTSNFTGVDGENITFGPGDLVLTPHDVWHNHGNVGDEAAINVSVLDLPLCEVLNAIHFEHDYTEEVDGERVRVSVQSERFAADYSQRVYGHGGLRPRFLPHRRGNGRASPMFVYRWERTRELLEGFRDHDGSPHEGISVEYVDPTTGRPPFPTMTFFAQMLRPGERTLARRQNASLICTPFEGRGHSIVGGARLDWEPYDSFAVPGGEWCEHVNGSDGDDAILFVASDEPTLKTLGFYARHGRTADGEVTRLD